MNKYLNFENWVKENINAASQGKTKQRFILYTVIR